MRRRVRAERARANDLEAEQRTVHTKLTVPFVDLHRLETGLKGCSVGPVSIPQQESWRRVPREGVADLRDGPRSRRMFGDIDMHDSAAVGAQDEDDEQPPEGGRRHRKEIDGHQIGNVILEKAPPRLRGGRSASHQILGHGGLGNRDAPLYHLAMHAGRAPERSGRTDTPDEDVADLGSDGWLAEPSPVFPGPVTSEPGAVPPDDGLEFHDDEDLVPVSTEPPKSTQNQRSPYENRGRFTDCLRTASCWRRAGFAMANRRRILKAERSDRSNARIMMRS